jgi:hypothetical protein
MKKRIGLWKNPKRFENLKKTFSDFGFQGVASVFKIKDILSI